MVSLFFFYAWQVCVFALIVLALFLDQKIPEPVTSQDSPNIIIIPTEIHEIQPTQSTAVNAKGNTNQKRKTRGQCPTAEEIKKLYFKKKVELTNFQMKCSRREHIAQMNLRRFQLKAAKELHNLNLKIKNEELSKLTQS